MKTLEFIVVAGDKSLSKSIELNNKVSDSVIFGTAIKWIFRANDILRKVSKGYLKATEPIELSIKCGSVIWETAKVEDQYKEKFKFGANEKSKRRFADNVWTVYQFLTSENETAEIHELTAEQAN
jgi:hypothetical protein